jgi:hypothetical protein
MKVYQLDQSNFTILALGHDGNNYFFVSHKPQTSCFMFESVPDPTCCRYLIVNYNFQHGLPITTSSGMIWSRTEIESDAAYFGNYFRYEDKMLYSVNPSNKSIGLVALLNDELNGFRAIYTYWPDYMLRNNVSMDNEFRIKKLSHGFRLDPLGRCHGQFLYRDRKFHASEDWIISYNSYIVEVIDFLNNTSLVVRRDQAEYGSIKNACFSPSGRKFMIVHNSHVAIYETEGHKELSTLFVPSKSLSYCCWAQDELTYAVADRKKQVFVYDASFD